MPNLVVDAGGYYASDIFEPRSSEGSALVWEHYPYAFSARRHAQTPPMHAIMSIRKPRGVDFPPRACSPLCSLLDDQYCRGNEPGLLQRLCEINGALERLLGIGRGEAVDRPELPLQLLGDLEERRVDRVRLGQGSRGGLQSQTSLGVDFWRAGCGRGSGRRSDLLDGRSTTFPESFGRFGLESALLLVGGNLLLDALLGLDVGGFFGAFGLGFFDLLIAGELLFGVRDFLGGLHSDLL